MTALTRQELHSLKRQLGDAYEQVLEAERAYRRSGDGMAAIRCKQLTRDILMEIDHVDGLIAKAPPLPTPVRIP
jgi:hypothetical protein